MTVNSSRRNYELPVPIINKSHHSFFVIAASKLCYYEMQAMRMLAAEHALCVLEGAGDLVSWL